MISVEEATKLIRERLPDFGETSVSFEELCALVITEDIKADREYPPSHRVMMDGIAVNYNVWREGKRDFRLIGICPAGEPAKVLTDPSSALEVMTGAPLPEGADLVIPYEHLKISEQIARITEELSRKPMDNVHLKGSDIRAGDVVIRAGREMHGPHWGIAASMGRTTIPVRRTPLINIISTGDELVEISDSPLPHQLRRSNAYALKASLLQHGFNSIELSHLNDDEEEIRKHFLDQSKNFDLMIYSGGVSRGKFDYLPTVWKGSGVKEIFHGVSQRPGKPLWFGIHEETKTAVLGLPGNPVSSLVCLHRYLLNERIIFAVLTKEITFKNDLTYFVPVRLESSPDGRLLAHPLSVKNSGEFTGLAESDGFIELPREKTTFRAGEVYRLYPWRKM